MKAEHVARGSRLRKEALERMKRQARRLRYMPIRCTNRSDVCIPTEDRGNESKNRD